MRQSRRQVAVWNDPSSSVIVPFPVPESDGGLVKALRADHPDAIRALCERHSGELLRVAARILGPDASIGLVVSAGIGRSLERLEELEDGSKLKVWLTSSVVTAARRQLRIRRYLGWIIGRGNRDPLPSGVHFSEQLLASYRVLDRLNDEQRIVFCLVVVHSMSLAEVATVMNISLVSARSVLDRACHNFQRVCAREPAIARLKLRSA